MKGAGFHVCSVLTAALLVGLGGCAPTRSYEWSADQGEEVKACYDACSSRKYKCYADCDFGMRCEMGCDKQFDACLSACPGLKVIKK